MPINVDGKTGIALWCETCIMPADLQMQRLVDGELQIAPEDGLVVVLKTQYPVMGGMVMGSTNSAIALPRQVAESLYQALGEWLNLGGHYHAGLGGMTREPDDGHVAVLGESLEVPDALPEDFGGLG